MRALGVVLACVLASLSAGCLPIHPAFDPYRVERVDGELVFVVPYGAAPMEDFTARDGSRVQSLVLYMERNLARAAPLAWTELPRALSVARVRDYDVWNGSTMDDPIESDAIYLIGNLKARDASFLFLPVPTAVADTLSISVEADSVWRRWVLDNPEVGIREVVPAGRLDERALELSGLGYETKALAVLADSLATAGGAPDTVSIALAATFALTEPRPAATPGPNGEPSAFVTGDRKAAAARQDAFLAGLEGRTGGPSPPRIPVRLVCMRRPERGACFAPGDRYRLRIDKPAAAGTETPPADFTFRVEKRDIWSSIAIGITTLAGFVFVMTY